MRKITFIVLLLLSVCVGRGYSHNIGISVALPENNCILDSNTESILKSKMAQILSNNGVTGNEFCANVMFPEVSMLNTSQISGGMRQIFSVELGVTFTVKNIITNTVFNTISISVKGEGYSEIEANRSAIGKIDSYSREYSLFVKSTNQKIIDYYKDNTSVIIAKANTLASQQLYDEALALLSTYPESMPAYGDVSKTITSIFKECQNRECSTVMLSAQAAFAQQKYADAADLVAMVDAQSDCADEAHSLLKKIKEHLDKEYRENMEMEKEKRRSSERAKLAMITAVKDIASAYFSRQTEYIFF